ncbi:MAG: glycerate kinase [Ornithinimicrobium sp.]
MRVLVVADRFGPGDGRSARQMATDVAGGWASGAPHDDVDSFALSDGSAGFVDAVSALADATSPVVIDGPFRGIGVECEPVPAQIVLAGDTAYIEAAHVVGRHLVPPEMDLAESFRASSAGVGELLAAARATGAQRIVVGVGIDVACHDGGRGLLQALGAGPDLEALPEVCRDWSGLTLVLATASSMPLTGFHGTSAALASEHGVSPEFSQQMESEMGAYTETVDAALGGIRTPDLLTGAARRREREAGAGVGGGLGYALQILGAQTTPGAALLLDDLDVEQRLSGALVVLVTQRYDWHSIGSGVVADTARAALAAACPTVLLAEEVLVGRREGMSLGISGSYALRSTETMSQLSARVAKTWSPPPRTS